MAIRTCKRYLKILWPGLSKKNFFTHYISNNDSEIQRKCPFLLKKFFQKTASQKSSKIFWVKFWPKSSMQNRSYTNALHLDHCGNWRPLYFCYDWVIALKIPKMSTKGRLKETGLSSGQKSIFSLNLGQNILHKVKKSSKIAQD